MSGSEPSTLEFVVTPFATNAVVEVTKAVGGDAYGNSLAILIDAIADLIA